MPKSTFKPKPASETFDVVCPKCSCDYMVPIMKLRYTKSFAGNRLQVEWPSHEGVNDSAMVACPSCWEIIRVTNGGSIEALGKKLAGK